MTPTTGSPAARRTRATERWGRLARVALLGVLTAPPPAARPARRRLARGRRAVLAGLAAFLAAQAGLNVAVRREWVPVRDPVFAEKFDLLRPHANFFTPHPNPPPQGGREREVLRVLALGSSRTQLGFDAARFAGHFGGRVEAFNFGCPAAGPMTAALYLRRLLAAGVTPDGLLLELHPCFLTPLDPPFEARWLYPYRLRPGEPEVLRGFGWDLPPPQHLGPRGYLTAAHSFRYGLLNRYAPVLLPCPYGLTVGARSDALGFVAGVELPPAGRPRAVERTFEQYAPALAEYHVGGPGCAAVRDVLARCAEHGIRAAVVLMPESSEFRGWYGPEGYAAVTAFARGLAAEFGVPLFDAREWVPDAETADGHHLTAAGAAVFTDRLAEAVASGQWSGVRGKTEKGKR